MKASKQIAWAKSDAAGRAARISAPEDAEIERLCKRIGYGAVMDSAMRLWIKKDPGGAFYIGGCLGYPRKPS